MKSLLLTALALALLAGCGGGTKSAPEAKTFTIKGTIKADDLYTIRYQRKTDRCVAQAPLGETLAIGKRVVVITDPAGTDIALGKITDTSYETVQDKGETYVSPGICRFNFTVKLPKKSGVYTASVPDLDVSARFTSADNKVTIKYEAR